MSAMPRLTILMVRVVDTHVTEIGICISVKSDLVGYDNAVMEIPEKIFDVNKLCLPKVY